MPAPIPPEIQAALQAVEDAIATAQTADTDAASAHMELAAAQRTSDAADAAQLADHQAVTAAVQVLVDALHNQFPPDAAPPAAKAGK